MTTADETRPATPARSSRCERRTGETEIVVELSLDGQGKTSIATGLGILDHFLDALGRHARIDLEITAKGDLWVDDHHTVEDCGLALGEALDHALGDRAGINRFGTAYAPLDEALARAVVDFSGRPAALVDLALERPTLGQVACENLPHFFVSLATAARMTLHLDLLRGSNDHHRAEAAFKAFALALRQAVARSGFDDVPSTKGTLGEGGER